MSNRQFQVGTPAEWADFERRNHEFLRRHDHLTAAIRFAFERDLSSSAGEADRVVFMLGKLCVEDFEEIFVLAGNGRGFGALKLLRGMFERYVTARHISSVPADARDFMDYYWVQAYRLLTSIVDTFGEDVLSTPDRQRGMAETRAEYERVKEQFRVPCCRNCKDTRINYTWTRRDLVTMAKKLGGGAAALTAQAYYVPLQQAHSTMTAIVSRMRDRDGVIEYQGSINRDRSDTALSTAHLILLGTIALQVDHFELGSSEVVDNAFKDYCEIWPPPSAA